MIARRTLLIIVCALYADLAAGSVLRVPQAFPTIQAAVYGSDTGDTILISAGIYAEDIRIEDRQWLTLKGKGKVVIYPASTNIVKLRWCTGITLRNLRISGGYFVVEESTNVNIRGCRITDGAYGIRVINSTAVSATKNRLTGVNGTAVWLSNSTSCTVDRNRFDVGGSATSIYLDGTGHSATANQIQGGATGIVVRGHAHLVANNRIRGASSIGLYLTGPSSGILENSIRGAQDGMQVVKSDYALIAGNDIRNASDHGMEFLEVAGLVPYGLIVRNNRIEKAAAAGIFTEASETRFARNRLRKCGAFGIYVRGDQNLFERNYARSQPGGFDLFNWIGANDNTYIDNDVITSNL